MDITSDMIKRLREKTGAGMMDCKRALTETGGDMEAAIEYLRKKGAAVAQKRADRAIKEGMIVTRVSEDGKRGVMVEVNCETDFVGRSDDFTGFGRIVAEAIEKGRPENLEAVPGLTTAAGKTIADLTHDLLAKVGERIEVRRFVAFDSKNGVITSYTHMGNKIGVLVELSGAGTSSAGNIGRDVAMQIAAMNPMVVSRDQLDKSLIEREMEIYRTQAKNEGKPSHILDKIATGRLEKFFQEVCLLEQTYIKDSGKTIKDALAGSGQELGVKRFQRFHLGEEIS